MWWRLACPDTGATARTPLQVGSVNGIRSEINVSFPEFKSWLSANGDTHYLRFRSTMGAYYGAELWFDQEMQQAWRR